MPSLASPVFFSRKQLSYTSNQKELLTISLATKAIARPGQTVRIITDSSCAASYLNKLKNHSKVLLEIAKDLKIWCLRNQVHLQVTWHPRLQVEAADRLSRATIDTSTYSLNPSLAAACFRLLEFQPQVDCMATARTTKCKHFISRFPEEGNLYTDIFSRSLAPLRDSNLFFNPPWEDSLIIHLLKIIREDRISGLFVLPLWPSRPWWPMILQLRASPVLILPQLSKRDLRLPTADGRLIPPPRDPPWRAISLLISGDPSKQQELLQRRCRWRLEEYLRHTPPAGNFGRTSALPKGWCILTSPPVTKSPNS